MAGLRPVVRSLLEQGRGCGWARTAATCRELLAVEPSLWTFARAEGVAPHHNAAERALRHGVIWRGTIHGTDGGSGSRLLGQMLWVVAACRHVGRGVHGFLTGCFRAGLEGRAAPSLIG